MFTVVKVAKPVDFGCPISRSHAGFEIGRAFGCRPALEEEEKSSIFISRSARECRTQSPYYSYISCSFNFAPSLGAVDSERFAAPLICASQPAISFDSSQH